MSDKNFFQKIFRRLIYAKSVPRSKTEPKQNGSMMGKLILMVEDTDDIELSCDEVFKLLDQYVEMESRGEDAAQIFPLVKRHLDRCLDCHEEYEALMRIIEATSNSDN